MNKIVKGLVVASVFMATQFANAEDLSVDEWTKEIHQAFRPTVEAAIERWALSDKGHAAIERHPVNAIRMYNLMRNIRYNEVWNDFIQRYPDSKNGRIAMCEYAKSQTLLREHDIVCTENFVPNSAIMQRNTLNPENRNHEYIPKIINPNEPKKRSGKRNTGIVNKHSVSQQIINPDAPKRPSGDRNTGIANEHPVSQPQPVADGCISFSCMGLKNKVQY